MKDFLASEEFNNTLKKNYIASVSGGGLFRLSSFLPSYLDFYLNRMNYDEWSVAFFDSDEKSEYIKERYKEITGKDNLNFKLYTNLYDNYNEVSSKHEIVYIPYKEVSDIINRVGGATNFPGWQEPESSLVLYSIFETFEKSETRVIIDLGSDKVLPINIGVEFVAPETEETTTDLISGNNAEQFRVRNK